MTQIRNIAAALLLGTLALLGLTQLLPADTAPTAAAPAVAVVEQMHAVETPSGLGTDFGLVTVALGEGTDFTQAQVDEILLAADRVCEGITAGVPVVVMADTLVQTQGIGDEAARDFVNLAATTRC